MDKNIVQVEKYDDSKEKVKSMNSSKSDNDSSISKETAEELCQATVKAEYDHTIERANRLDNKVSIMLAFTGIVFIPVIDLARDIFLMTKATYNFKSVFLMMGIYTNLQMFIAIIILQLSILLPKKYSRIGTASLILGEKPRNPKSTMALVIATHYENAILSNNKILDKENKKFITLIILMILSVIMTILLYIIMYGM